MCVSMVVVAFSDHVHQLKLTGAPERPYNPNSPIGPGTPFKSKLTVIKTEGIMNTRAKKRAISG